MSIPHVLCDISPEFFDYQIIHIRLIGRVLQARWGDVPYHWRYFLVIRVGTNQRAIIFNMTEDSTDSPKGLLLVRYSGSPYSKADVVLHRDFEPMAGATVGDFYKAYIGHGRHMFKFSKINGGTFGCLEHNFNLLEIMEKAQVAVKGSHKAAWDWVYGVAGGGDKRLATRLANPAPGSYYNEAED